MSASRQIAPFRRFGNPDAVFASFRLGPFDDENVAFEFGVAQRVVFDDPFDLFDQGPLVAFERRRVRFDRFSRERMSGHECSFASDEHDEPPRYVRSDDEQRDARNDAQLKQDERRPRRRPHQIRRKLPARVRQERNVAHHDLDLAHVAQVVDRFADGRQVCSGNLVDPSDRLVDPVVRTEIGQLVVVVRVEEDRRDRNVGQDENQVRVPACVFPLLVSCMQEGVSVRGAHKRKRRRLRRRAS